ncbi:tetratricopeptide repeat protein [Rubripirellula amarantea]|nr:hypothetical protein [Rubripirellula amarantea]
MLTIASEPNGSAASTGEGASLQMTDAQMKMLQLLQQRVEANPGHSEGWRSLGRLQNALGDHQAALASSMRAIELDPFNAAAHFDVGQLLKALGLSDEASVHFNQVHKIAPASSYAEDLRAQGHPSLAPATASLGTPLVLKNDSATGNMAADSPYSAVSSATPIARVEGEQAVTPVGYQIQSFDGSDDLEQRFLQLESEAEKPLNRLRVFIETGVLYNSNVTLTPVSRELAQSDSGSFQAFASPDLDWKWIRTENSRLGPMFRGYFTANESTFQEFNMASFQPGVFGERDFTWGSSEAIGRLEYIFSNDFFDGEQVDDRHAVTASLTVIRPDLDAIYSYLTIAQANFRDDGVMPSQTSLDGTTITAGTSRFFQTGVDRLPMWSLGVDLESADTDGDDYRYKSVNLHSSTGWNVSERWKFIPTCGIGYRDYADFSGPVSRNEFFWRAHGRLQYAVSDSFVVALVAGHDRFASENDDYDTERTEGGVTLSYTR